MDSTNAVALLDRDEHCEETSRLLMEAVATEKAVIAKAAVDIAAANAAVMAASQAVAQAQRVAAEAVACARARLADADAATAKAKWSAILQVAAQEAVADKKAYAEAVVGDRVAKRIEAICKAASEATAKRGPNREAGINSMAVVVYNGAAEASREVSTAVVPASTGRCDMPHCLHPTVTHYMRSGYWRWCSTARLKDAGVKKICREHVPAITTLCENCKNWCTFREGLGATKFRFRPAAKVKATVDKSRD